MGPFFNVMGVKFALAATMLADIAVSFKNGLAPFGKFCAQSGAVTFHRLTIFECITACALAGTGTGAKDLGTLVSGKAIAAIRADKIARRVALLPALFRTILRSIGAVGSNIKRIVAHETLNCSHALIISQYVAVGE